MSRKWPHDVRMVSVALRPIAPMAGKVAKAKAAGCFASAPRLGRRGREAARRRCGRAPSNASRSAWPRVQDTQRRDNCWLKRSQAVPSSAVSRAVSAKRRSTASSAGKAPLTARASLVRRNVEAAHGDNAVDARFTSPTKPALLAISHHEVRPARNLLCVCVCVFQGPPTRPRVTCGETGRGSEVNRAWVRLGGLLEWGAAQKEGNMVQARFDL